MEIKVKSLIYLIVLIYLFSCKNSKRVQYRLFEPNPGLTINELKRDGFYKVKEIDVNLFTKSRVDTTYNYQFTNKKGNELQAQSWFIENVKIETEEKLASVLKGLNLIPTTKLSLEENVAVLGLNFNCVYLCRYLSDEKELVISFNHILKNKE